MPAGIPTRRPTLEAPDYSAFRDRLRNSGCRACGLADGRNHIVVDRGDPAARLLAVGEAPGATEDRTGRAFSGRAGATLDALFASVGLDTERDLLVVNVVKCRPPGNRAPRRDEAAACRPFLDAQLRFSPARLVVLLGSTALRHFAPERARAPMREVVGRFFRLPDHPGREFASLYHPAALLYNRRLEPAARRHARAVADRLVSGTATAGG